MSTTSTRIWDLPTRIFHWLLAACVIALVVTAKIGGNAMEWHLRLGHAAMALLVFRVMWGFFGGYWSRFATFLPTPSRVLHYLRGQSPASEYIGHNPLGALSVLAMLLVLLAQVATGLVSDDEIAFSGPLTRWVSGDTIAIATGWHKDWGQWLVWGLLGLHLCAVIFYSAVRRKRLVPAMLHGDQHAPLGSRASADHAPARAAALLIAAACAAGAWWVYGLGSVAAY